MLDFMSCPGIKIKNLSTAEDTQLLKRLLRQLSLGRRHNFDCRNAGTVARFLTALCAVTPGHHHLYGDERLCQRPMAPLFDALRSFGCQIKCLEKEGFFPIEISGVTPVASSRVVVDCSQSSQFASAILMAAAYAPHGLAVELQNVSASEPYIDMTLEVFNQAGINWALKGNPPAYFVEHKIPNCDMVTIEKDWSAASYFYTAAALKPEISLHITGLAYPSLQGDSAVKEIYTHFGVETIMAPLSVDVQRTGEVETVFTHDFTRTPDIVPAVAVCCAALGIQAHLKGVTNLRLKESDRIESIVTELKKMNCKISATDDEIIIKPSKLKVIHPVETYGDHRIAMAFGSLKVLFPEIEILNTDVVSKSYPNYFEMMDRVVAAE